MFLVKGFRSLCCDFKKENTDLSYTQINDCIKMELDLGGTKIYPLARNQVTY